MNVDISFELVEKLLRKQHDLVNSTCLVLELKDEMQVFIRERLLAGHTVGLESAFRHAWRSLVSESPPY